MRCVYSILIGDYEVLNEQAIAKDSKLDFICFTDNPELTSTTWKIRVVEPEFKADPIRSQRRIKLLAHEYLADYEESLYIDNNVLLKELPEKLFEKYLTCDVAVPYHSFRNELLDEFLEVAKIGLDDPNRIFEQFNHYSIYYPEILNSKPLWTGMMLRKHNKQNVKSVFEFWYSQILRYSRRDQLSVNLALDSLGEQLIKFELDNHESEFHSWPHSVNRKQAGGNRNIFTTQMPGIMQLRDREIENLRHIESIRVLTLENRELIARNTELASNNSLLSNQNQELISKNSELDLNSSVLSTQNQELICSNTEQNVKLNALLAENIKAEELITQLKIELLNKLDEVNIGKTAQEDLNKILNSRSWKVTSIARNLMSYLRKLFFK